MRHQNINHTHKIVLTSPMYAENLQSSYSAVVVVIDITVYLELHLQCG